MEEIENEVVEGTETEETSPETPVEETETVETEETTEEVKDIDFDKELETLEAGTQPKGKTELEKAKRALHFNAERVKELGGDPTEIIGTPVQRDEPVADVDSAIERKFAERDARQLTKSDAEFRLVMWYVKNKGLSVSEAHLLANKGKVARFQSELQRSQVETAKAGSGGRRVAITTVPARSPEEVKILANRGLVFNPKTKTYQGKIYEEYFDGSKWASRKIQR